MTTRVLFVCLGNICRSPTAEGVLRAIAAREFPGLKLDIDSAGTANYHVGEPPDRRTVAAARRRGYDLAGLRARQVQPRDFSRFDYVLAMDRANLAELERLRPAGGDGAARAVPRIRARSVRRSKCPTRTTAASRISNACSTCAKWRRADCWRAWRAAPEFPAEIKRPARLRVRALVQLP